MTSSDRATSGYISAKAVDDLHSPQHDGYIFFFERLEDRTNVGFDQPGVNAPQTVIGPGSQDDDIRLEGQCPIES